LPFRLRTDGQAARTIAAPALILGVAALLASVDNLGFWRALAGAAGGVSLARLPLLAATFLIVTLLFNAGLTLASFRHVAKPALVVLVMTASCVSYFGFAYGAAIDKAMIQNLFETDAREAGELLSWQMACTVALTGVLPSVLIARAALRYPHGLRGLAQRAGIAGASLLAALLLLAMVSRGLAPIVREHRELRYLLAPTNTIHALSGYLRARWKTARVVAPLGRDAVKGPAWRGQPRPAVTVIVLGETARAANFSLNGYGRDTNPRLARVPGLISFTDVQSCGTSTAVSVPCVFSALGREGYTADRAASQEGLLDVLSHAGLAVLWRDNNSGCKGVCSRVLYENEAQATSADPLCDGDECYDERLLAGLPEIIRESTHDLVIVLHQKGSHGPEYTKRYPPGFGRFGPVCAGADFQHCAPDSIVAAYDNTILYTDYFLSRTVDMLRAVAAAGQADTAMLYFSDHGESLGENSLYLHGLPYLLAPAQQTHVPMLLWMSDAFAQRFGIDRACLAARRGLPLSHDHVFHSVLGMLDVRTRAAKPELDLFRGCTRRRGG
jgi:lipid A ethanolaminephosphotransferase